jgi:hypothetical protein
MRPASRFPSNGTAVCWISTFDSMKATDQTILPGGVVFLERAAVFTTAKDVHPAKIRACISAVSMALIRRSGCIWSTERR